MGASNSKSVVVSQPAAAPVTGFHVKISFDGEDIADNRADSLEEHHQHAYKQGKDDGTATIRQTLDNVANQVYGNIKEQLTSIEQQQVAKAETKGVAIASKLKVPAFPTCCSAEEEMLASCLQKNHRTSSLCRDVIMKYEKCSTLRPANVPLPIAQ